MGLEDFKSEDENGIGSISTRKKIKNVKLSKDSWKHLLYHDPEWASYFANDMDKESIKAMVEVMDELINDGREGVKQNDETEERIENEREQLVDDYLSD